MIAGLAVHVADPGSFVAIYLGDAATTVVVVVVLTLLPARTFVVVPEDVEPSAGMDRSPSPVPAASSPGRGGYRQVLSDQRMRRFLVATTVLALAGYGAINAGLVGYATTVVHVTPRTISVAFAANTAFIVAAQPVGLRVVRLMRRTVALSVVAAFFAASWVMLWVAGFLAGSTVGDVVTVCMFVVFVAGEVLPSP